MGTGIEYGVARAQDCLLGWLLTLVTQQEFLSPFHGPLPVAMALFENRQAIFHGDCFVEEPLNWAIGTFLFTCQVKIVRIYQRSLLLLLLPLLLLLVK